MVLPHGQGAGDASNVATPSGPVGRAQIVLGDDVGHADPPAGAQHPVCLGEHRRLVGRQVDHAVGDDDVDRRGGQGNVLDLALEELDIGRADALALAPASASISSVMSSP